MTLTPRQKAAVMLVSLSPEASAQLLQELGRDEALAVTGEIAQLPPITPALRRAVLDEFMSQTSLLAPAARPHPLAFLERLAPADLVWLLRAEHAQTLAVVIHCLESQQARLVMEQLKPALQAEVAQRLAELDRIEPEDLETLRRALQDLLQEALEPVQPALTGRELLLNILSHGDRVTEERLLHGLTHRDPRLALHLAGPVVRL